MQKSSHLIGANEDLLIEIFLRLPVKSLSRFKCVSVKWLNLISSHYFSKNHTLKNPNPTTSGLVLHNIPSFTHISLGYPDTRTSFGPIPVLDFLKIPNSFTNLTIVSSCNGLLLGLLVAPPRSDNDILYIVSNPTTKKSNPLPPLENLDGKPIVNMDLAFDPQDSPNYKVVCIRHCNPPYGPDFEIHIFSSETGSWKICQLGGSFYHFPKRMLYKGGVYWNKGIHYLDPHDEDSLHFDIESETLRSLQMPPLESEVLTMRRSWFLGQSGGHLNLVDIEANFTIDSCINIYDLMDDYSGWLFQYEIGLSGLGDLFPEMVYYVDEYPFLEGAEEERFRMVKYYKYFVLGVVRKEGENGFELILSIPNKMISYNPGDGDTKVIVHFGDDRDRRGFEWRNVVQWVETLSPV